MPVMLEFGSVRGESTASIARSWKLLLPAAGVADSVVVARDMATAVGRARTSAWCALAVVCAGCAAPNLYTTPRATPVGRFSSVLASQLLSQPELQNQTYSLQVGGRYGFAPRFDGGLRTNFASVAADLKWN